MRNKASTILYVSNFGQANFAIWRSSPFVLLVSKTSSYSIIFMDSILSPEIFIECNKRVLLSDGCYAEQTRIYLQDQGQTLCTCFDWAPVQLQYSRQEYLYSKFLRDGVASIKVVHSVPFVKVSNDSRNYWVPVIGRVAKLYKVYDPHSIKGNSVQYIPAN